MSDGGNQSDAQNVPAAAGATSTSLLEGARARDPVAWERLVALYGPVIYQWGRRAGLSPADTADVVQSVFVAVLKHLAGFRRERAGDSFRKWLRTITANAIRDFYRQRKRRANAQGGTSAQMQLAQIPDPQSRSSEDDASQVEQAMGEEATLVNRAMERVRGRVKPHNWQAFYAVMVQGRPANDVAEELGIPTRLVYNAKYRVLRMIRDELSDLL